MKNNKLLFKYFFLSLKILSLFLFIFLIYKADWNSCFKELKTLNLLSVIITIIVIYVGLILKSIRWKNILKTYQINEKPLYLIKIFLIGGFLGIITPGKVGDFGRVYYLKRHKNWKKAFSSLIIDRANDLIILFIISFYGAINLKNKFPNDFNLKLEYKSIIVLIICLFLSLTLFIKFRDKLLAFYELIRRSSSFKNYLIQLIITLIAIIFLYSSFIIIAQNLNINIPAIDIFFIAIISGILNLLPITILGIGVREATLVFLLGLYGVNYNTAISFSLIIFAIQIITLLPGAYFFYKSPINLDKEKLLS